MNSNNHFCLSSTEGIFSKNDNKVTEFPALKFQFSSLQAMKHFFCMEKFICCRDPSLKFSYFKNGIYCLFNNAKHYHYHYDSMAMLSHAWLIGKLTWKNVKPSTYTWLNNALFCFETIGRLLWDWSFSLLVLGSESST